MKAFYHRAEAYFHKALYDLDRAIPLEPNDGQASYIGGLAHFYLGHFPEAALDYERSLHIFPENRFGHLLLFLACEWSGQDGGQDLARHTAELDLQDWPGSVISLFLSHATPEQVLAAVQHADPRPPRERECKAFFYLGQHYLRRGDRNEAARLFPQALDTGITHVVEYTGATMELERLGSLALGLKSMGSVAARGIKGVMKGRRGAR
jgi:lipoprotein NlpI